MGDSPASSWPLAGARPGQIVVIARWSPGPGDRETVLGALAELVAASRAEPGCLGYQDFHPEGTDRGDIVLMERYADHQALDAHRDSDHFRSLALERILPLLQDREVVVTIVA